MSRLPRAGFRDHSPRSRGSQDGEPSLVSFQLSGSGAAVASSCLAFWAGGQVLATMSGAGGLFAVNRSRRLGRFAFGFQLAVVSGFLFGEHFTRIPCRFVWHHGPGDHADLTCQGDASFLAPRLATACDTVKRFLTIQTGDILAGALPRRARRLLEEWIELRRGDLIDRWQHATSGEPIEPVDPLD